MIDGTVLTITSLQYYRDNGTYSCIATNSRGSNRSFAEVKVHGKGLKHNYGPVNNVQNFTYYAIMQC